MRSRIFRLLVCLVLVCVILVNCSPIRAQATGAEAILLSSVVVNPSIAVTAVLFGLGVMAVASATAAFTKLVDEVTADMVDKGLISSQGVDMYRSDADGASTYLVNQELVEAVREYLFETQVIQSSDLSIPDGFASYNGHVLPLIDAYSKGGACLVYYFPSASIYNCYTFTSDVTIDDGTAKPSGVSRFNYSIISYTLDDTAWCSVSNITGASSVSVASSNLFVWANRDIWNSSGSLIFSGSDPLVAYNPTVSDGLAAGQIAPQNKTFAEGYSEWASGAKTLPTLRDGVQTDAESAYIALGMGLTQEETMAMTQAAVQSGVGTYEGTGTATDAVTATGLKGWLDTIRLTLVSGFTDLIDGIVSIPSSIVSGISSLFIPSAEAMAAQQDKWTTLLSDRFGAVYDSVALIDNIAGAFTLGATQTQIRFPLITIPFGDVTWEFGGWMVDVVPDGFQVLVDALKVGIDILCTLAFVNAMKHRLERVLEGRG